MSRARQPKVKYGPEWQRDLFRGLANGAPWYRVADERVPEGDPARDVIVRLGYTLNGRPVINAVLIGAEQDVEITGNILQRVSPSAARDVLAAPQFWSGSGSMQETRPTWGKGRPKGGESVSADEIADDYRLALRSSPSAPTQFLVKKWKKSSATVRRRIARIRSLGLID